MILLLAVIAGLLAGVIRAWIGKRRYEPAEFRHVWLVIIAFLPQWLAFYLPATRNAIPDWLAAVLLVISQALLLVFVLLNIQQPGFIVLGLGLLMNLVVITANGGLMPISPEKAAALAPQFPLETWQSGNRFGNHKDVILLTEETRFWQLSDRFISPAWFPYRFIFSLGDVFVAIGAFWTLWAQGGAHNSVKPQQ